MMAACYVMACWVLISLMRQRFFSSRGTAIILIIVLGILIESGCYSKTTFDEIVVIRHGEQYAYEIRLHSRTEGRGNAHNPFDLSKYEYESNYSICVNKLEGEIAAKDLIFTQLEGCKPNPSFWVDQTGYIEIRDECLTVALEAEYTKGLGRKPLPANGRYTIAEIPDKQLGPR